MNCFVVIKEISAYEGYLICGVEIEFEKAKELYEQQTELTPHYRIYVQEVPVGKLFNDQNIVPILDSDMPGIKGCELCHGTGDIGDSFNVEPCPCLTRAALDNSKS